jgi:hypothetical protein
MSTPDIIAARAAGGLADTPWNTVVTELCRRVIALEGEREPEPDASPDHARTFAAKAALYGPYCDMCQTPGCGWCYPPAEAPEPEAPAVLWVVVGPHKAAWAVAQTQEDCAEVADRYRAVYPGDVYTVHRYRLDS